MKDSWRSGGKLLPSPSPQKSAFLPTAIYLFYIKDVLYKGGLGYDSGKGLVAVIAHGVF